MNEGEINHILPHVFSTHTFLHYFSVNQCKCVYCVLIKINIQMK